MKQGKIKNNYGLKDGISETLYKYKEELAIILKDETDDKFTKRTEIRDMIDNLLSLMMQNNNSKMITEERKAWRSAFNEQSLKELKKLKEFFDKLTDWKTIDKNYKNTPQFLINYLN